MKVFSFFFVFIQVITAEALFGIDAGINQTAKKVEGALLASTLIDEIQEASKDGKLDFTELDRITSSRNAEYRSLSLRSRGLMYEAESIGYMDDYNSRSSKATKALKKSLAIYGMFCSLSPDSCQVASQERTNMHLKETNFKLDGLLLHFRTEAQKDDLKEIRKIESRLNVLEAIGGLPLTIYNGLSGGK